MQVTGVVRDKHKTLQSSPVCTRQTMSRPARRKVGPGTVSPTEPNAPICFPKHAQRGLPVQGVQNSGGKAGESASDPPAASSLQAHEARGLGWLGTRPQEQATPSFKV